MTERWTAEELQRQLKSGKIKARISKACYTPYKNKTEKAYADNLEVLRLDGEIRYWRYEPVRLRLADKTWYTPDFMVINNDFEIEFHETKGFMREAARVRINVAAEIYPFFTFYLIYSKKGGWDINQIPTIKDKP